MITPRLCRMVLRVDRNLRETLVTIAARLLSETGLSYSCAAIVRGLIDLGLASLADASSLAPLFVGARVKRGRKPGERRAMRVDDLDLEHEDDDQ